MKDLRGSWWRQTLPRSAAVAVLVLLVSPVPAASWEAAHYFWTYYLALQVGYTPRQAYQVASGAYALDWDSDTSPMPHGTVDALRTLHGMARPEIRRIWRRYHAFTERAAEAGDFEAGERAKEQVKRDLWALALREKNPGPYLHYIQDYHSHFGWDDDIGHAPVGHLPDFLSWDLDSARRATEDTIDALQNFMRQALGGSPREPDRARVYAVLDYLASANPYPISREELRSLFPRGLLGDGYFFFAPAIYSHIAGGATTLADAALDPQIYMSFVNDAPKVGPAAAAVRTAVQRDQEAERLPTFPEKWFDDQVPEQWIQFDYNGDGVVTGLRDAYPVEEVEVRLGSPEVSYRPASGRADGAVWVEVHLPYIIDGQAELAFFLDPLPVREVVELDGEHRREGRKRRLDGTFDVADGFSLPASQLLTGAVWTGIVHAYGEEPQRIDVPLSYRVPHDAEAGGERQDPSERIAELEGALGAASSLAAEAAAMCGEIDTAITETQGRIDNLRRWLSTIGDEIAGAEDPSELADHVADAAAQAYGALEQLGPLRDAATRERDRTCDAVEGMASAATREEFDRLRAEVDVGAAAAATSSREAEAIHARVVALVEEARAVGAQSNAMAAQLESLAATVARNATGLSDTDRSLDDVSRRLATLDERIDQARVASDRLAALVAGASADLTDLDPELQQRWDAVRARALALPASVDEAAACRTGLTDRAASAQAALTEALAAHASLEAQLSEAQAQARVAAQRVEAALADAEATLSTAELFSESVVARADDAAVCRSLVPAGWVPAPAGGDDSPGPDHPGEGDTGDGDPGGGPDTIVGGNGGDGGGWTPGSVETVDDTSGGDRESTGGDPSVGSPPGASVQVDNLARQANDAFARCDYTRARALLNRIQELDPGNPVAAAGHRRIAEAEARRDAILNALRSAESRLRGGAGVADLEAARETIFRAGTPPTCLADRVGGLLADINTTLVQVREAERAADREAFADALGTLVGTIATTIAATEGFDPPPPATGTAGGSGGIPPVVGQQDPCATKYHYPNVYSTEPVCDCPGYVYRGLCVPGPGGGSTTAGGGGTAGGGEPEQGLDTIEVQTYQVTVTVWDHGCEDGDRISLSINGRTYLANHTLTKSPYSFDVRLSGASNSLEIVALDSGTDCPPKPKDQTRNSAAISVSNAVRGGRQSWTLRQGSRTSAEVIVRQ